MAKKPLKEPDAPPGPQYQFFDLLQKLVRRHGDLPLSKIVDNGLYVSRQVLHRALVGPDLPSRELVKALVSILGCSADERDAALKAYDDAIEDRIERHRLSRPRPSFPVAAPGSERQTPRTASSSENFTMALRQLREDAGKPTLRLIEHTAQRDGLPIARSSVHDWFSGRSIPRNAEAVHGLGRILSQLARQNGQQVQPESERRLLLLWQQAWREKVSVAMRKV